MNNLEIDELMEAALEGEATPHAQEVLREAVADDRTLRLRYAELLTAERLLAAKGAWMQNEEGFTGEMVPRSLEAGTPTFRPMCSSFWILISSQPSDNHWRCLPRRSGSSGTTPTVFIPRKRYNVLKKI